MTRSDKAKSAARRLIQDIIDELRYDDIRYRVPGGCNPGEVMELIEKATVVVRWARK